MFARTRGLTLRPAWPEDAPALAAAIGHEPVVTMLSGPPWPYTEAHAAEFVTGRGADDLFFLILAHEAAEPRLVGGVGLHALREEKELGCWLTPSAWGEGYATEAARAVVDIARHTLGLTRLVSGHFVDNPASGRVLAKLGFRPTGEEMRRCAARGQDVSCALMSLELI